MNRVLKYISVVVIFVTSFVAIKASTVIPDTVILGNYPYVRFIEKGSDIQLSDDEFYNVSRKIVFPINKYTLPKNSPLLKEIENEVIPLLNKDSLSIRQLMIRGAASPEGPYRFNKSLSEKRGKSLFDFINSRLVVPVSENDYTRMMIPEDYQYLCIMMQNAGDADYLKVKHLCDKYLPTNNITALKTSLQRLDGGKLWRRMLRTYFPDLRASRFVIFLEKPEREPEPITADTVKEEIEHTGRITTIPEVEPEPVIEELVTYRRRELLSVKTNLLLDGAYVPGYDRWCPIPNVAIEYYPLRGHFTFGASIDFPWWQDYWAHKYFQVRNYQVEARYYLKRTDESWANGDYSSYETHKTHETHGKNKPAFSGWYLQAYAHAGLFSVCFDANRGWEGEGIGGGLGLGYVLPISRNGHWRLEFGLQAGFFRCKYDPYQWLCPVDPDKDVQQYYYKWTLRADQFQKRQYRYNWIGPTRIGVTLTYDLLYRKRKIK